MSNMAKRSFLYFYVSFVGTGLQNVIPQVFFDSYYPTNRELLLSICLLAGAAASILGSTWWSYTQTNPARQETSRFQRTILVTISFLGVSLIGLFITSYALTFIILFILTKVLSQYLVNTVDDRYVQSTMSTELNKHAQHATLFQLIGIVVAPVYFSFFYAQTYVNGLILLLICFLAAYLINTSLVAEVSGQQVSRHEEHDGGKLDLKDKLFLFYIITTSAATLIFSANIIYLLQDYYYLDSPIQKGGILLGVVNLTAILGVAFQKMISKVLLGRKGEVGQAASSLRIHLTIPVLSIILIFILYTKLSTSMIALTILFALMGIFYGLFRLFTREYASQMATLYKKRLLLTMYNNMSNYSILVASILLFCLSLLDKVSTFSFLPLMLWSVISLFSISAIAVLFFGRVKVDYLTEHVEKGEG